VIVGIGWRGFRTVVLYSDIDGETLEGSALKKRRFWLRAIWISSAGVVLPPMVGLLGTVIGMVGAFGELSQSDGSDPGDLAGDISFALLTTAWGLVISFLASIALVIALVRFFKLPKPGLIDGTQTEVESPGAALHP
jgi:hypothetical protein